MHQTEPILRIDQEGTQSCWGWHDRHSDLRPSSRPLRRKIHRELRPSRLEVFEIGSLLYGAEGLLNEDPTANEVIRSKRRVPTLFGSEERRFEGRAPPIARAKPKSALPK